MVKIFYDGCMFYRQKAGGISVVFKEIFKRLGNNDKFECLCTFPSHNICPDVKGIKKAIVPKIRPNRVFPLFWRLANEFYFSRFRPHIFHSTYYSEPYFPRGVKTVLTIHDMIFEIFSKDFWLPWHREFVALKKKLAHKADAIVCPSESTKRDVLRFYNDIDPEKVSVVYNGLDSSFTEPVTEDEKRSFREEFRLVKPYLLYVGRVSDAYKNFDLLLDVYAQRSELNSRFDLVVVRPDELTDRQRGRVASLGGKVKLYSEVSFKQLKFLYCCSHVFVYPSKYEGFGIPILEAMACGVPVVTARSSSLPEVGGDAAMYFDPTSVEDLLQCLERVCDDNGLRDRLIEKGRENLKRFSWDDSIKRLEKLYSSLI